MAFYEENSSWLDSPEDAYNVLYGRYDVKKSQKHKCDICGKKCKNVEGVAAHKAAKHRLECGEKPKYKKFEKAENIAEMEGVKSQIESFSEVVVRSAYHWTVKFKDGFCVELHPSVLGFYDNLNMLYFKDSSAVVSALKNVSTKDRDHEECDFDVIDSD